MTRSSGARLKSTGEPVMILDQSSAERSGRSGQRYLVQLPPQQPWHKPRYQEVHEAKLQFSSQ